MDTDASCHRWESKTFSAFPPEDHLTIPAIRPHFSYSARRRNTISFDVHVCDEIFAHLHKRDAGKEGGRSCRNCHVTKVNALTCMGCTTKSLMKPRSRKESQMRLHFRCNRVKFIRTRIT